MSLSVATQVKLTKFLSDLCDNPLCTLRLNSLAAARI